MERRAVRSEEGYEIAGQIGTRSVVMCDQLYQNRVEAVVGEGDRRNCVGGAIPVARGDELHQSDRCPVWKVHRPFSPSIVRQTRRK